MDGDLEVFLHQTTCNEHCQSPIARTVQPIQSESRSARCLLDTIGVDSPVHDVAVTGSARAQDGTRPPQTPRSIGRRLRLPSVSRTLSPRRWSPCVSLTWMAQGGMTFGDSWKELLGECNKETTFQILDFFFESGMALPSP